MLEFALMESVRRDMQNFFAYEIIYILGIAKLLAI